MGILENNRHERFAQELAQGKPVGEAYVQAGYKPSPAAATRLSKNVKIKERVDELKNRAAEGVVISNQWVLERLVENAIRAAANEDFGPSNRALELIGKERGMFVDRSEVDMSVHTHEEALTALEQAVLEHVH